MKSEATIIWQDGTEEIDIPTTQLYYSISLDDHEFFPGEWVVCVNLEDNNKKFGVVQNVNYLERTAAVLRKVSSLDKYLTLLYFRSNGSHIARLKKRHCLIL